MLQQFAAYPSLATAMNARYRGHDVRDWEEWRANHHYPTAEAIPAGASKAMLGRDKANLTGLEHKTALRHLIASNVDQPTLEAIGLLVHLERLELEWPLAAADLSALARLPKLRFLSIDSPRSVENFSLLASLPALRTLIVTNAKHLGDLEWLRGADHLQVLGIEGSINSSQTIASIAPLDGLTGLEAFLGTSLRLLDKDLMPLAGCPKLRFLGIARCAKKPAFDALRGARPDIVCSWFDDAAWGKVSVRPA